MIIGKTIYHRREPEGKPLWQFDEHRSAHSDQSKNRKSNMLNHSAKFDNDSAKSKSTTKWP